MAAVAQSFALVLAAFTIGWTACLSFMVAPAAFQWLKEGRGERFVRRLIKEGHGFLTLFAGLAAGLALIGGAGGGAAVMACAALFFALAQWTLSPANQGPELHGMRKNRKHARVTASALTAFILPVVLAGVVMIGAGL